MATLGAIPQVLPTLFFKTRSLIGLKLNSLASLLTVSGVQFIITMAGSTVADRQP